MKTLHTDPMFTITMNNSGEVFVNLTNRPVTIRVHTNYDDIVVTAAGCEISPWSLNGLPAFRVSAKP